MHLNLFARLQYEPSVINVISSEKTLRKILLSHHCKSM